MAGIRVGSRTLELTLGDTGKCYNVQQCTILDVRHLTAAVQCLKEMTVGKVFAMSSPPYIIGLPGVTTCLQATHRPINRCKVLTHMI